MSSPTQTTTNYLALAGVVFQAIGLLLITILGPFGMMGGYGMMGRYAPMMGWYPSNTNWSWMSMIWLLLGVVIVAFSIYGLKLVSSPNPSSIHSGAILLLVFAIIAFPTMWGLLVGSALMFAAAIISLSQHP